MKKKIAVYFLFIFIFTNIFFNFSLNADNTKILEGGRKGKEVQKLQHSLKELGYFNGNIDGIYGEKTINAVVKFQVKANLKPDGKAGEKTKYSIKKAQGNTEKCKKLEVYSRGPEVLFVQKILKNMGIYSGPVDGIYGRGTSKAVEKLQQRTNLKNTGIVNQETWDYLRKREKPEVKIKEKTEKERTQTEKSRLPLLQMGDRGESVIKLQKLLKKSGFDPVTIDGIFGYQTQLTLKLFQQFYGLRMDGICGEGTWKVLTNSDKNGNSGLYTVQRGDTLWGLAQRWDLSVPTLKKFNNLENPQNLKAGQKIKIPGKIASKDIKALSWGRVDKIFPEDKVIIITEIKTGLSLRVKRLYGSNHADVEPLTPRDTEILKRIYGGEWDWERRAVVAHLNGYHLAGSINGNPHGNYSISNNNFQGHICLHFKGSRLHKNNQIDGAHQQQIRKSASHTWPLGRP